MIKSIYEYGELTVRVRGKKSFMLVKSDYDAMVSAENIQTALRRLEGTKYQPYISQMLIEEFNLGKAEENLTKAYLDDFNFILSKLKNRRAIEFFREFNRLFEFKTLASIFRSIVLGVGWEKALEYTVPFGRLDSSTCRRLIEEKNVKNVFGFIEDENLIKEVEKIVGEVEDPILQANMVELALNRYALERVWEKLLRLKGRDRLAVKLVGITIDTLNIMAVLRLKKLEFKPDEIETFLIPIFYMLKDKEVKRAVTASNDVDALNVFASGKYVNVISPLLSRYEVRKDLSLFEVALKRYHAKECERIFFQPFFHLGEALAYLHLKMYEVKDLISILTGKYFGLSADKIEYSLVLHQPPYPI